MPTAGFPGEKDGNFTVCRIGPPVTFTGPGIIAGNTGIGIVHIMRLDAVTGEDVHAPMTVAPGWLWAIRPGGFPASFMTAGKNKKAMKKGGARLTGPAFFVAESY